MLTLLFIPLAVYAEESDSSKEENKEVEEVNIYFFRGDGCSYCAKAEDWFEEIEKDYGKKFNVVDYETLKNEINRLKGQYNNLAVITKSIDGY